MKNRKTDWKAVYALWNNNYMINNTINFMNTFHSVNNMLNHKEFYINSIPKIYNSIINKNKYGK